MAVSVEQAVLNVLTTYLAGTVTGGVTVRARWPSANTAPAAKSITCLQGGKTEYLITDFQAVNLTNVSTTQVKATWAIYQCTTPLRLDVWTTTDFALDDIRAQLSTLLNKGVSVISTNADPAAEGVSLSFSAADGYAGTISFMFEEATLSGDGPGYQRSEYRATIRGEARFCQTQDATTSRFVAIALKEKAHDGAPAPAGALSDIVTVTASGVTRTTG